MRVRLENEKDNWYIFFDKLIPGKSISTTFLITIIVYHVMYLLFQFGGGLLINRSYLHNGRLDYL